MKGILVGVKYPQMTYDFETVELDDQNNIIQTIKGTGDTWWYRVFKYTYHHFWFQDEN